MRYKVEAGLHSDGNSIRLCKNSMILACTHHYYGCMTCRVYNNLLMILRISSFFSIISASVSPSLCWWNMSSFGFNFKVKKENCRSYFHSLAWSKQKWNHECSLNINWMCEKREFNCFMRSMEIYEIKLRYTAGIAMGNCFCRKLKANGCIEIALDKSIHWTDFGGIAISFPK